VAAAASSAAKVAKVAAAIPAAGGFVAVPAAADLAMWVAAAARVEAAAGAAGAAAAAHRVAAVDLAVAAKGPATTEQAPEPGLAWVETVERMGWEKPAAAAAWLCDATNELCRPKIIQLPASARPEPKQPSASTSVPGRPCADGEFHVHGVQI
jgi:hypothetical protein